MTLEDLATLLSKGLSAQMTESSGYMAPLDEAGHAIEYEGHIDLRAMATHIIRHIPQTDGAEARTPEPLGAVEIDETGGLRITISPAALKQIG